MNFFRFCSLATLSLAFLGIWACNLFNPDGSGSAGSSTESQLINAQKHFRDAEYTKAYELFAKIVQKDSTRSEAYMGMAKAGMRMRGVNPMILLRYVNVDTTEIPFMNASSADKNNFYTGMRLVDSILTPLARRDSLTALYEAHQNRSSQTDAILLETFRSEYSATSYAGFPLSDRVVTQSKFSVGHAVARMVTQLMRFLDLNKDGMIDERDLNIRISRDENGNPKVDLDDLYSQAIQDPATVDMLNSQIDDLANGLTDLSSMIENLGGSYGLGDDSVTNAMTDEIKGSTSEQINAMQGTVMFYKLGDGIDNDGDGCVDEEIYDGIDNDGDGLIDEDLRLVPNTRIPIMDHDQDGFINEDDEQVQPATGLLGFVAAFEMNESGERNSTDKEIKAAVAADTDPDNIRYSLEDRKRLIGGCWVFYDQTRFNNWFLNR